MKDKKVGLLSFLPLLFLSSFFFKERKEKWKTDKN